MAIISSFLNRELGGKKAVLGELGLGGEIRPVAYLDMRIKEIEKMGFDAVILGEPINLSDKKRLLENFKKIKFIFVKNLSEAIKILGDKIKK